MVIHRWDIDKNTNCGVQAWTIYMFLSLYIGFKNEILNIIIAANSFMLYKDIVH